MSYIIIVLLPDGQFDCVHKHRIYTTRGEAESQIRMAKKEDALQDSHYEYRIIEVRY